MSETKDLIEQLNSRVDKLINRIAESNQLAEKQEQQILALTGELRQKETAIANLQAELNLAKEAKDTAVTAENDQLKSRINEMVREIDECISLLKVGN